MRSARPLHLLAAAALGLGLGLPTTASATSIALAPASQTAHVGDVVSDGTVTVEDGRICVLACTNPDCEPSP